MQDAGTAIGIIGAVYAGGALIYAALRAPDKRAVWDRIAGTQVRYRRSA